MIKDTSTPNSVKLDQIIEEALERVAPLWPLEHFVAVNPYLGLVNQPFAQACATLRRTLGKAPVFLASEYLTAFKDGRISVEDLAHVADDSWTTERLLRTLQREEGQPLQRTVMSFADLLDETLPHAHWSGLIAEELAKWCAVHYDRNQTMWNSPWRHLGLFEAWKSAACHDRKPEAFGLHGFRDFVRSVPNHAKQAIAFCLEILNPQGVEMVDFLHRQLSNLSGWAGYVRYLVREDSMRSCENPALVELLAIRLIYDAALYSAFADDKRILADWRNQRVNEKTSEIDEALARWQAAYEIGYQKKLGSALVRQAAQSSSARPIMQAVFCIDVRSEIIRRHLESAMLGIHTLGFAGFFGFPVSHQSAHACRPASRCPVLLVPPVKSTEPKPEKAERMKAESSAWKAFQNSATSCFSFVEALGLSFSGALLRRRLGPTMDAIPRPALEDVATSTLADMAAGALRGMSLTESFARLILICGHGSHSANNPYASSLDCGACGGHGGEVNARLAAHTFNDPDVRKLLAQKGIHLPEDTHFIAARHDTLSDDVHLYDRDRIPASHLQDLAQLESALRQASAATRRERAQRLGLQMQSEDSLERSIRDRGTDIAQVRPEWALANNAALIVAPRSRTASLRLDGRTFLHEYDPQLDADGQVLTTILTAPVVVASWINLQYFASRMDPERFAAGDKTIHQVMAGIGVIEGNAGDLRTGLPMQSIHNGKEFIHEPRRLSVYIESSREALDAVLSAHPEVGQLFDHEWIHLISIQGNSAYQRVRGVWRDLLS